jgi:hypothetical protein
MWPRPACTLAAVVSRPSPFRALAAARRVLVAGALVASGLVAGGLVAATASPAGATTTTTSTAATTLTTKVAAYWLVASDGGVFAFGGAGFYGSTGSMTLNKPVVGMAATADSAGYWLVASDGGIFSFGDAQFYGSTGAMALNKPIVGMAPTPTGKGYWLVASDGGIFSFGAANFFGSMGGRPLNQPIVGMAAMPTGDGYWLVAADGGIFAFGSAQFYGSTGSIHLNKPIVGMTPTPDGQGYWFTASDGGVFAYGDAQFYGSVGNVPQKYSIVAMAGTATGKGYWFTNSNGAVSAYGTAPYWGSAPQVLNKPIVSMSEATGSGQFGGSTYPSGSYGYDVSNYQCTKLPPRPYTIGAVEVEGASFGSVNRCLSAEAAWAAGGLNLYVFLTYGTSATSTDPACASSASPTSCNFGFNAAVDAFAKAQNAGVNTSVGWWLDVETANWTSTTAANASLVQGAIDGLHSEGLNNVGIYASPGVWSKIVGTTYKPAVPYWAADWGLNPVTTCQNIHTKYHSLPSGPVAMVQYSSGSPTTPTSQYSAGGLTPNFDNDYAC